LFRIIMFITLFPLILLSAEYRLGEGLQIADTPVYVGGYSSLNYTDELNGSRSLTFDDIALMVYAQQGAWSFMGEAEMNDVYYNQFELNEDTNSSFEVHAERIYVRYEPSDTWRSTLGKFNSPIGFWNLMPINVLRSTTSSPLITEQVFPRFTTGASIDLTLQEKHRLTLLLQATPDLDTLFHDNRAYNNFNIDQHFALGYREHFEQLTLRFNAGYFRERIDHTAWFYGYMALKYNTPLWEVMGEAGYRKGADSAQKVLGGYVQIMRTVFDKHQLIVRAEGADDDTLNKNDNLLLFGYTYRPLYPVALKSEFQWHPKNNETELLLSVSVLF